MQNRQAFFYVPFVEFFPRNIENGQKEHIST